LILALLVATTGCRRENFDTLYATASGLSKQGDPETLEKARAGFNLAESHNEKEWGWKFRILAATYLSSHGKPAEALKLLDRPYDPSSEKLKAEQSNVRGWAEYNLEHFSRAEEILRSARTLAHPTGDVNLIDKIDNNWALSLAALDRLDEAEAVFRQIAQAAHARGDTIREVTEMTNLGYLYNRNVRYEEAVDSLRPAVANLGSMDNRSEAARARGVLGFAYLGLGDNESALEMFMAAAEKAHSLNDPSNESSSRNGASKALLGLGRPAEAVVQAQIALDRARDAKYTDKIRDALDYLSDASLVSGDWKRAQVCNKESRAMKAGDESALIDSDEIDARIAIEKNDYNNALGILRNILRSVKDADPATILQANADLADLYSRQGLDKEAEAAFEATISFSEKQRDLLKEDYSKLSYLQDLMRFYRKYVSFLIGCGDTEKALEVADSSRARLLAEKLIAEPRPPSAVEFRGLAKASGSVLLSYWLAPKESYVWVVTPGRVLPPVRLPGEEELGRLVQQYRGRLEDTLFNPLESKNAAGIKLWELLIKPIEKFVPSGTKVILVPDGSLHSLNFETLLVPGERLRYWIDDVTIRVAPSLGLLVSSETSRPRTDGLRSALLMGAPRLDSRFNELPHAVEEMNRVKAHFPPSAVASYQGAAAYPAAYREASPANFRFLYFGTHALANSMSPLDSALILSAKDDVYKLYAREIAEVPLRAELVTVSACRGAGAKTYSGEGQVGLAWAFLHAGARNVIAGLWDVDDSFTPGLMDRMYGEIENGADPAVALRTAKLDMIHSRSPGQKPAYWGPFILFTGNYR
jgi:CHAT domain-containing protein